LSKKESRNPAWFFINNKGKMSLWAKCKNCGKWNSIRNEDVTDLSPLPQKPIEAPCSKCEDKKGIFVERVFFARKGMKEPRDC
jgi:predicted ATP-dependent serine protease